MESVDLAPILNGLVSIFVAVLTAGAAYGVRRLSRWLNLREDSEVRGYLDQGLLNIIRAIDHKMRTAVDDRGRVQVTNDQMAEAVRMAVDHFPDAVRRFRLGRDQIEDLLAARWGVVSDIDRWQETRRGEGAANDDVA